VLLHVLRQVAPTVSPLFSVLPVYPAVEILLGIFHYTGEVVAARSVLFSGVWYYRQSILKTENDCNWQISLITMFGLFWILIFDREGNNANISSIPCVCREGNGAK